jgi:predicted acylesterase/phospholipase RssA/CRP-like cAMP-binding protein
LLLIGVVQPDPQRLDASPKHLQRLLAGRPVFQGLDQAALSDLAAALVSAHVRGGERIFASGQAGVPLVLVMHGGLRASFVDAEGVRRTAWETFRGGTVGEALLLSGRAAPFDLHAIRDSHLLYLAPERFGALITRRPELLMRFARMVAGRALDLYRTELSSELGRQSDRLPRSIALYATGGPEASEMRDRLARALTGSCRTSRLGSHDARRILHTEIDAAGPSGEVRLSEWLGGHESRSDLLVFECDTSDGAWLDFGLRQADCVMVLAQADLDRDTLYRHVWHKADLGNRPARVELARVHPRSTTRPRGGAAYLDLPGLARLHNVRAGDPGHAERLARWLVNRPVGLVLGGGGAFGIAHVGVLKALEEFQVPIDIVGGTSMGAIFGGGPPLGWSADAIMEEVRSIFSSRFALYDPTIPVQAVLAGKKLDRILRRFFENIDFADLWATFFCVSTNISSARSQVHGTGDVWGAVRASCSIPGLFPPFAMLQELFVDGGLVDNLPVDLMAERCRGPIVAVEVFPYRSSHRNKPRPAPGPLRNLPGPALAGPHVFDVVMHATFAGSEFRTAQSLSRHPPALHLVPSLTRFGILDWRAYEGLYRAGYEAAKRELESGRLPRTLWEGPIEDLAAMQREHHEVEQEAAPSHDGEGRSG